MKNDFIECSEIIKKETPLLLSSSAFLANCDRRLEEFEYPESSENITSIRTCVKGAIGFGSEEITPFKEYVKTLTFEKPIYTEILSINIEKYIELMISDLTSKIVKKMVEKVAMFSNLMVNKVDVVAKTPTFRTFLEANSIVTRQGAPLSEINCFIHGRTNPKISDELKGLFHSNTINKIMASGYIGTGTSCMNWYTENALGVHTAGTYAGNAKVASIVNHTETMQINTNVDISGTLKRGDHITIDGVFYFDNGIEQYIRQFVVANDVESGSKKILVYTDEKNIVVSGFPSIKLVYPAGKTYRRNLVYHKRALTMVIAKEQPLDGVTQSTVRSPSLNIALTYRRGGNIDTGSTKHRLSILMACKSLIPEWGCIVADPLD